MLGESHSLFNEFPSHTDDIRKLCKQDSGFAKQAKKYNELDENIRSLELENSPISDVEIRQLKHDRSVLKDLLFKRIQEFAAN